jgi:hypothetical protein
MWLKAKMGGIVVRSKLGGQTLGIVARPRFDSNVESVVKALRSLQEQVACWLKDSKRSHKYLRIFV